MTDKNGNGWVLKYVVGVLVTLIVFIAIPTLANHVIINDKSSRLRDESLREDFNTHILEAEQQFHKYAIEQQAFNSKIENVLTGIAKDIEYIKKEA